MDSHNIGKRDRKKQVKDRREGQQPKTTNNNTSRKKGKKGFRTEKDRDLERKKTEKKTESGEHRW